MGYIILCSGNPKLSYVIKKNPNTSPHVKTVRKGFCVGWFFDKEESKLDSTSTSISTSTYVMRFLDCAENVSFPKNRDEENEYDYLPYMQYCSPMIMSVVIRDMLNTIINKGDPEDIPEKCYIEQAVVKISGKCFNIIKKLNTYIPKYKIELTQLNVKDMYNLIIGSNKSTVCDLLQYAYLIGYVLNSMTFSYTDKPTGQSLDKVIRFMNKLAVPYYIRYTLKTTMISRKDFERVKKELEGGSESKEKIVMTLENTQGQRFQFILKHLLNFYKNVTKDAKKNVHIIDIGCGEGYYVRRLLRTLKENKCVITYHAHDTEQTEMDKIDRLIESKDELYSCVIVHRNLDDMISKIKTLKELHGNNISIFIIFSEVIEHIPIDQVEQFMVKIVSQINFDTMLITTPRREFNVNYLFENGQFRHEDHKQEFTKDEFVSFIDTVKDKVKNNEPITHKNLESVFSDVGDTVNGVGMAQAIILNSIEK